MLGMRAGFARSWLFLCILFVSVLTGACDGAQNQAAPPAAPPPEIPVVEVQYTKLTVTDRLPGRVTAIRTAEVRPQVGGILKKRLFEEGDMVKAGQALYQIEPDLFRAEVAAARAARDRAKANLALAESEANRATSVRGTGALSEREIDAAVAQAELAKADLAQAEAALARASLNLQYATVRAPIAGRIGISRVTEGALLTVNDPLPLATIHQIDDVHVDIKQPVARYEELRRAFDSGRIVREEGLPVELESPQGKKYEETGRLLFADIDVDASTSEVTLRVLVNNPKLTLLPGMFVRALITFGEDQNALLIPQQAVQRDASLGAQIFVVNDKDEIEVRPVTTGRVVDNQYLVLEGVEPGDRVVVEGHDKVRTGTKVVPTPWKRQASSTEEG